MVKVSNMKSLLANTSSRTSPPALADERLSCKSSQNRKRSRYLIASCSELETTGGFSGYLLGLYVWARA